MLETLINKFTLYKSSSQKISNINQCTLIIQTFSYILTVELHLVIS